MSNKLSKLARKFTIIINKQADVMKDPFLKKTPEKNYIQPEMTEEMDEIVKDSLNLVILLERAFLEFQKDSFTSNNKMGSQLSDNVLIDLEDIQDALTNSELLNFDLDTESSYLDVVDQNVSMLKSVLDMLLDGGRVAPEFKTLDTRVFKWVNELIENSDKLHDKAMSQSEFYDQTFQERPVRMIEQDERDPDDISQEDIHPDYGTSDYEFNEETGEYELAK